MAHPISIRVLSDEGLVLEDESSSIIAPGALGYLGMLSNHAPLITTMQAGILSWRIADGGMRRFQVQEGILEISKNKLTLLTRGISELKDEHAPQVGL